MRVDVLVAVCTLLAFLGSAWIWRQKRELRKVLEKALKTDAAADVLIGAVTAADVIHQINLNAPGLLSHLASLDHLADPHSVLSIGDIIPPHALTAAVASGDLTPEHLVTAAHDAHFYTLDLAHTHVSGFAISDLSHSAHALDFSHLNLADAAAHVPLTALIVKGWKNWQKLETGRLSGAEWAVHTATDVASSTAGAVAGTSAGWAIAASLVPFMGPAAVLVVPFAAATGAVGGGFFSRFVKKVIHGGELRRAEAALIEARTECTARCVHLRKVFLRRFGSVMRAARRKHRRHVSATRRRLWAQCGFIRHMLRPTLLSVGLEQSIRRSKKEFARVTKPYYRNLLREVRRRSAEDGGRFLFNQAKERFLGVSALDAAYTSVYYGVRSVNTRESERDRARDALYAKIG